MFFLIRARGKRGRGRSKLLTSDNDGSDADTTPNRGRGITRGQGRSRGGGRGRGQRPALSPPRGNGDQEGEQTDSAAESGEDGEESGSVVSRGDSGSQKAKTRPGAFKVRLKAPRGQVSDKEEDDEESDNEKAPEVKGMSEDSDDDMPLSQVKEIEKAKVCLNSIR